MKMEIFVLFWISGLLAVCAEMQVGGPGGNLLGGLSKADIADPEVQKALEFATSHINSLDRSAFYRVAVKVDEVNQQVVSGAMYHFRGVRMASTTCVKASLPSDLSACALSSSANERGYDFKVVSQPWMPTPYRLLHLQSSDFPNCAVDLQNVCPGFTLDNSGVCLLVPDAKLYYSKAQADCRERGGSLIEKNDVTDGVRKCLADIHPHDKRKMVWLVGRKDCTVYDLKGQGNRYPGCKKKRYYACRKDALPVPTTTIPTTTFIPTTEVSSPEPFTTDLSMASTESTGMELVFDTEQAITMGAKSTMEHLTSMDSTKFPEVSSTVEPRRADSTEMTTPPTMSSTDHFDNWGDLFGQTTSEVPTIHIDPEFTHSTVYSSSSSMMQETSLETRVPDLVEDTMTTDNGDLSSVMIETTYILTMDKSSTPSGDPEFSTGSSMADTTETEVDQQLEVKVTDLPPVPEITSRDDGGDKSRAEPAMTEEIKCPEGFYVASSTLCLSLVQDEKIPLKEATQACVNKGAQPMRLDQVTDDIKRQLKERVTFAMDEKIPVLRLEKQDCLYFNNGVIESSTCTANTQVGYICVIDHGRTGGSKMNKAVPVAGATFAVTSIAILVYHTLKARRSS